MGALWALSCAQEVGTVEPTDGGSGGSSGKAGGEPGGRGGAGSAGVGAAGTATLGGTIASGGDSSGGETSLAGESGNGGAPPTCDPSTGTALAFKNDVIDMLAGDLGPDLPGGNAPRTIECWAHYLGDQSWLSMHSVMELGRRIDGPDEAFGIDMAGRNGDIGNFDPYTNGVSDNDPVPLTIAPEGWHHLAWAYDGAGHFQFTVDGNLVAISHPGDGSAMLKTTQGILTLGGSQNFGLDGWGGELDEVRVWGVFRSVQSIASNMRVKLTGHEPGLIAYYDLDEGSGNTASDAAGNNGHKLAFCTNNGGPCPAANKAAPTWVPSTIPGPFTCAD